MSIFISLYQVSILIRFFVVVVTDCWRDIRGGFCNGFLGQSGNHFNDGIEESHPVDVYFYDFVSWRGFD
jgi:hypothetical protein